MQTFGIFAALGLLGGRRGTLAFLIYLLLGIVGLPVFSGFSAGAGVLFGRHGRISAGLSGRRAPLLGPHRQAGANPSR